MFSKNGELSDFWLESEEKIVEIDDKILIAEIKEFNKWSKFQGCFRLINKLTPFLWKKHLLFVFDPLVFCKSWSSIQKKFQLYFLNVFLSILFLNFQINFRQKKNQKSFMI